MINGLTSFYYYVFNKKLVVSFNWQVFWDVYSWPYKETSGASMWLTDLAFKRKEKKISLGWFYFFSWETDYLRLHLKSMNLVPSLRNKCLKNDKIVSSTPLTGLTMFEAGSQVTTMKIQRKLQTVMGIYIKLDPSWTGKMHEKMEIRNNSASHSSL